MHAEHVDIEGRSISLRSMLGIAAAAAAMPISMRIGGAQAAGGAAMALSNIKAMTFDIQGTVVDYYRPFTRISSVLSARKGLRQNWSGFLVEWNAGAFSIIQAIIGGQRPWIPTGQIYREALDNLLTARGLADQLDETDSLALMSVWSQMVPWRDSAEGITRLKRKVTVAALSNAGMARSSRLPGVAGCRSMRCFPANWCTPTNPLPTSIAPRRPISGFRRERS